MMDSTTQTPPAPRSDDLLKASGWSGAFRTAWIVFAITWIFRFSFVSMPQASSGEETGPYTAVNTVAGINFWDASSWAERWVMVVGRGGQNAPLGRVVNLLVGHFIPTEGEMSAAVQALAAFIAAVALIGAAGRLLGDRGRLMGILLGSLSGMLMVYSSRLFMQTQAAMWLSLALFVLTSRRGSSLLGWTLGGLFASFAMLTSDGLQPILLALAAGLGVQLAYNLFRPRIALDRRVKIAIAGPLLAGFAFMFPYLLVRRWAQYAGQDFNLDPFLLDQWHAFWKSAPMAVPAGQNRFLWLHQAMELEVAWPLAIGSFVGAALFGRRVAWSLRVVLLATIGVLACLLLPAFREGGPWIYGAVAVCTSIGLVAGIVAAQGRWIGPPASEEAGAWREPVGAAPFGLPALVSAVIVASLILWRWPQLAARPRHFFPYWPLFMLLPVCLLAWLARGRERRWVNVLAFAGLPLFCCASAVVFRTKNTDYRASAFEVQHPQMKRLRGNPITFMTDAMFAPLADRVEESVYVVSSGLPWYAGYRYDEDGYNPATVAENVKKRKLEGILNPLELFQASLFYETKDPSGIEIPPPGTHAAPETKDILDYRDSGGKRRKPIIHPYRGLAMRVNPGGLKESRSAETLIRFPMHIDAPTSRTIGFEWDAIAPYAPNGSKVEVEVIKEEKGKPPVEIAKFVAPVKVYSPSIIGGSKLIPFQFFHRTLNLERDNPEIRIKVKNLPYTAWLPDDPRDKAPRTSLKHWIPPERRQYVPPLYFYVRRSFISTSVPPPPPVSGFGALVESQTIKPDYANFDSKPTMLAQTGHPSTADYKPLIWTTEPWDGRAETSIAFQGTTANSPQCELTINGQTKIRFLPQSVNGDWSTGPYHLSSKYMGDREGTHAIYILTMPADPAVAGRPVTLEVRVLDRCVPTAWFGLRDLKQMGDYLP